MKGVTAYKVIISASVALLILLTGVLPSGASVAAQAKSVLPPGAANGQGGETYPGADSAVESSDAYFRNIYRDFYLRYRLGPGDQIAIRVLNQPDHTMEQVTVSPVGRIYQPLIGDIEVAGLTVPELTNKLTVALSQYIINPTVSVSLLEANSAKIGVLGEVRNPGILVMARPMTVFDAITASGGVTDHGSRSNVTVLRQGPGGRNQILKSNVKRIMEGKAGPEENFPLLAGDTIIVHGNFRKKFSAITSLAGFGYFLSVIADRAQ